VRQVILTTQSGDATVMADKKNVEKYTEWLCPHCKQRNRALSTAGVSTRCQYCGKERYTSSIEVVNKKSSELLKEIRKRRKREVIADKEHE
jgi:histidinol phosphatase-like enzyme